MTKISLNLFLGRTLITILSAKFLLPGQREFPLAAAAPRDAAFWRHSQGLQGLGRVRAAAAAAAEGKAAGVWTRNQLLSSSRYLLPTCLQLSPSFLTDARLWTIKGTSNKLPRQLKSEVSQRGMGFSVSQPPPLCFPLRCASFCHCHSRYLHDAGGGG